MKATRISLILQHQRQEDLVVVVVAAANIALTVKAPTHSTLMRSGSADTPLRIDKGFYPSKTRKRQNCLSILHIYGLAMGQKTRLSQTAFVARIAPRCPVPGTVQLLESRRIPDTANPERAAV